MSHFLVYRGRLPPEAWKAPKALVSGGVKLFSANQEVPWGLIEVSTGGFGLS